MFLNFSFRCTEQHMPKPGPCTSYVYSAAAKQIIKKYMVGAN